MRLEIRLASLHGGACYSLVLKPLTWVEAAAANEADGAERLGRRENHFIGVGALSIHYFTP